MARETEGLVRAARAKGTLGHQCEHLDFGACFKCRGRVVAKTQETDQPLRVLSILKDSNSPTGLVQPFPKVTFHGAR